MGKVRLALVFSLTIIGIAAALFAFGAFAPRRAPRRSTPVRTSPRAATQPPNASARRMSLSLSNAFGPPSLAFQPDRAGTGYFARMQGYAVSVSAAGLMVTVAGRRPRPDEWRLSC